MIGFCKTCAGDSRGSVTVELALLAPILATMIIGVIDISIAYGQKLELEQGAQRAIEKVMQTTGNTTVADTLQQEVVCQVNGTEEGGACSNSTSSPVLRTAANRAISTSPSSTPTRRCSLFIGGPAATATTTCRQRRG